MDFMSQLIEQERPRMGLSAIPMAQWALVALNVMRQSVCQLLPTTSVESVAVVRCAANPRAPYRIEVTFLSDLRDAELLGDAPDDFKTHIEAQFAYALTSLSSEVEVERISVVLMRSRMARYGGVFYIGDAR